MPSARKLMVETKNLLSPQPVSLGSEAVALPASMGPAAMETATHMAMVEVLNVVRDDRFTERSSEEQPGGLVLPRWTWFALQLRPDGCR